jgi:hypothetical protein
MGEDTCKDIFRAGQGGLISRVMQQARERPGTATPSSRMRWEAVSTAVEPAYTSTAAAATFTATADGNWVLSGGGITLPDPPSPLKGLRSPVRYDAERVRGDSADIADVCML